MNCPKNAFPLYQDEENEAVSLPSTCLRVTQTTGNFHSFLVQILPWRFRLSRCAQTELSGISLGLPGNLLPFQNILKSSMTPQEHTAAQFDKCRISQMPRSKNASMKTEPSTDMFSRKVPRDQRAIKWFGLKGTLKPSHSIPTFHYPRLLRAPSNLALNTSSDGAATASLANL